MKKYRYGISIVMLFLCLVVKGGELSVTLFNDDDINALRDPFSRAVSAGVLFAKSTALTTESLFVFHYLGRLYSKNRMVGVLKVANHYFLVQRGQIVGREQGEIIEITKEALSIAVNENNQTDANKKIITIKVNYEK